ncbi:MAG TPA: hypothetical protein VGM16_07525 [Gammaproteobacteria bacterium]|jgi:hypothetical protein
MKSQVGLGRLYPDGRLEHAHDKVTEQSGESPREETPVATELVSVVVHVEKSALNELLQKST